jgi:glutathione S-transferase
MKLYMNSFSPNCRKVQAVAHALGMQLETQMVDLSAAEQRTPDYVALNPNGKVPTLVDGSTTLWESNAILCYLAGKADTELWPKSSKRYDILRWMFWESNHFGHAINQIAMQKLFHRDTPDQAIIDQGLKDFRKYAGVLDGALHGAPHILGAELTLADFAVGVGLGYTETCELPLDDFPHVKRWWQAFVETPSGKMLLPPSK